MGRGSTVALAAAAALLVSLPMLLVTLRSTDDAYDEQEARRMFVEWKAKYRKTYDYAGEEECRYAVFKDTSHRVARARAAGVISSGFNGLKALNGFSATTVEEFYHGCVARRRERPYEQETRRVFVLWKAKYGKTYRDVGEEECRYRLFKGNHRRFVVLLNADAAAGGQNVYGLNKFGDLTDEEVRERCYLVPDMEDRELSARCQAAAPDHESVIRYQVCPCIAMELKQTESEGSTIPGDEAHM